MFTRDSIDQADRLLDEARQEFVQSQALDAKSEELRRLSAAAAGRAQAKKSRALEILLGDHQLGPSPTHDS